ncbi:DUF3592 domain-containing protein [Nocardioides solisilvae]|uniref:DUF3592 domain-containing protein n=1 Tax=Nocardioides solisilvae TaxID=1542435 RepID=UPI000D74F959|nr:DUF3592 domain-containing protein [Nocardioides solisilvae]
MLETISDVGWGWLPVAFGAGLIWFMCKYLMIVRRQRRSWTTTEATVGKVWFRDNSASGGSHGHFFKYRYTDLSGQEHAGEGSPWFRKPKRQSKVVVRYDPDRPARSEVAMPLWGELGMAAFGMAAGVFLILVGLSQGG